MSVRFELAAQTAGMRKTGGLFVALLVWAGCSTQTFILDDRVNGKVDAHVPMEGETDGAAPIVTSHDLPAGWIASELTYFQHAKSILDARCVPCHAEAGFGPFALETYAQARVASMAVHDAVAQERMPPFPADDANCRKLIDQRNMPATERAILEAWALAGAAEGDARKPPLFDVPPVPESLGPPSSSSELAISYAAARADIPVHRCFVVDPALTAHTSLTAVGVNPARAGATRRVLVHLALPGSEPTLALLEAEDTEPGYDCYYGGRFDGSITVADNLVGASRFSFPDRTAVTVPPGSRFVLELDVTERSAENPSLALWRADVLVERAPSTFFVVNTSFVIPRGEPSFSAQATGTFVSGAATAALGQAPAGTLWGVSAHMHLRGKSARVELERADGSRECLLSVPRFRADWAGGYRFAEPLRAQAGDKLVVRCEWDNSAEGQPIVDGKALVPRDLTIGTSVLDETCLGTVLMVED